MITLVWFMGFVSGTGFGFWLSRRRVRAAELRVREERIRADAVVMASEAAGRSMSIVEPFGTPAGATRVMTIRVTSKVEARP